MGHDSLLIFFFPSLVIRTLLVRTLTNVVGAYAIDTYEYICAQQSKKERSYRSTVRARVNAGMLELLENSILPKAPR